MYEHKKISNFIENFNIYLTLNLTLFIWRYDCLISSRDFPGSKIYRFLFINKISNVNSHISTI